MRGYPKGLLSDEVARQLERAEHVFALASLRGNRDVVVPQDSQFSDACSASEFSFWLFERLGRADFIETLESDACFYVYGIDPGRECCERQWATSQWRYLGSRIYKSDVYKFISYMNLDLICTQI